MTTTDHAALRRTLDEFVVLEARKVLEMARSTPELVLSVRELRRSAHSCSVSGGRRTRHSK